MRHIIEIDTAPALIIAGVLEWAAKQPEIIKQSEGGSMIHYVNICQMVSKEINAQFDIIKKRNKDGAK